MKAPQTVETVVILKVDYFALEIVTLKVSMSHIHYIVDRLIIGRRHLPRI